MKGMIPPVIDVIIPRLVLLLIPIIRRDLVLAVIAEAGIAPKIKARHPRAKQPAAGAKSFLRSMVGTEVSVRLFPGIETTFKNVARAADFAPSRADLLNSSPPLIEK